MQRVAYILILLLLASPCWAQVAQWDEREFGGSPYVTISAINTTGGITTSRTSGTTPCFIHASASAITATGTSNPYEDLEYTWTAEQSDGGGGWEAITDSEGMTNPVTGAAYNTYTDQQGPEAVFVFRDAGTYRITLNCRGQNGSGYTTASTTQEITVSAFSGTTYYFDPTSGSDANDGLSTGAPKQTWTAYKAAAGANRQLLIKRGETLTATSEFNLNTATTNGMRFGAYGSGADPIIQGDGTNFTLFKKYSGISTGDGDGDVVFSDLSLDANGSGYCFQMNSSGTAGDIRKYWYFDNVSFEGSTGEQLVYFADRSDTTFDGAGFWNCDFDGSTSSKHNMYHDGGCGDWRFIVGGTHSGNGTNATLDHHYYINVDDHFLFDAMPFGAATNRSYCLNINRPLSLDTRQYVLVRNCDFNGASGCLRGMDCSNSGGTPSNNHSYGLIGHVIAERSVFRDLTNQAVFYYNGEVTLRDSVIWNCGNAVWVGYNSSYPGPILSTLSAYSLDIDINFDNGFNIGAGQTNAHRITDCRYQSTSTGAEMLDADGTAHASSTINDNVYYAPNDSDGEIFYDKDTATTLTNSEWQALGFDADSTFDTAPDWRDPENGDFRSSPTTFQTFIPGVIAQPAP